MFENKNNKGANIMEAQKNNGFGSMIKAIEQLSERHQKRLDDNKKKHEFIINLDVLFRKLQDNDNQYQIFYDLCHGLNMKQLKFIEKETKILIKEEKGGK
jgi:hypothetical protein